VSRPIRVEWAKLRRIRSISQLQFDRTHQPPNARKQELGVAHAKLDLKRRNPEITKIRRMAKIPEYENGAKRHE